MSAGSTVMPTDCSAVTPRIGTAASSFEGGAYTQCIPVYPQDRLEKGAIIGTLSAWSDFMRNSAKQTHRLFAFWKPLRLIPLLGALATGALVLEKCSAHWELKSWKAKMEAKGEIFDARRLWPTGSEASMRFSNDLAQAVRQLAPDLRKYASQLSAIELDQHGARPGSQKPRPFLWHRSDLIDTWEQLDDLILQSEPGLKSLRRLMQNPPPGLGYDEKNLENDSSPNFVDVRISAQALHAAAIADLHNSDIPGALENLLPLVSFGKVYRDDPTLVNLMIRIAIMGLDFDACWDALQFDGWTDHQLATLQDACQSNRQLFTGLPLPIQAERITRSYRLNWFRTHSYHDCLARYQALYDSLGWKARVTETGEPYRTIRQWLLHPIWSFAWADQEELDYLRNMQLELAALRDVQWQRSWCLLRERLTANHRSYRSPVAAWRFYGKLPLAEEVPEEDNATKTARDVYPYPDFSRAWYEVLKQLTANEMVIGAIAVKRYKLSTGKFPSSVASLVPAFVSAVPTDFMDGQALRYRVNSDGSFTLYSAGEDGKDDGGNPEEARPRGHWDENPPWNGRDWVWPRSIVGVKPYKVAGGD